MDFEDKGDGDGALKQSRATMVICRYYLFPALVEYGAVKSKKGEHSEIYRKA
ncbi:uncharacterized protein PHALS_11460 [Plasmopara halstedii]|uniref:Uncharacterized protein n=1 Tax=Plasmopara halstedii TaxID=4781 RepID=A0A0P1A5J1_PLAHL|nr:uncharacterized protein PHALS_11460 [Plasmopara halstedii]CEG35589.1 hypothetical protein PHALS_11460 [Plasmopara halstedii]|eukprot:XP_024571958.1 hypothetical protein PHALS_11460 [Plasmopara halstedii]